VERKEVRVTLTETQLRDFLPALPPGTAWTGAVNTAAERFALNSPLRLSAFLAQVAWESGEFRRLVENLNYSAARLVAVWPTRFTAVSALQYEHQPEKIANYVYASRLGNGDVASGDGWRYRGRGLIQLTGRTNYRDAGNALGLPFETDPDLLSHPTEAALSAGHFWAAHDLNRFADEGTVDAFDTITHRINGGSGGLLERRALWERAKAALA
jgi:putative chitinase